MKFLISAMMAALFLAGCSSAQMRARKEQREKAAVQARLYCEFINGEVYSDIDVALNLEMAKRCDSDRPFSITQYRTPSENQGIMYCCATTGRDISGAPTASAASHVAPAATAAPAASAGGDPRLKKAEKKDEKKQPAADEEE